MDLLNIPILRIYGRNDMIKEYIYVLDWKIKVIIILNDFNINFIFKELLSIGCKSICIKLAINTIIEGVFNVGFTYSNHFIKESILIIGKQDSVFQLINTISHESRHLQQHIANSKNLDLNSEDVCYLLGEIVLKIYTIFINNHLI